MVPKIQVLAVDTDVEFAGISMTGETMHVWEPP